MRSFAFALGLSLVLASAAHAQVTPIADAGPDVTVTCVAPGGTPVNLDGTASSIGPDFTYLWSAPGVQFSDPNGPTTIGIFPVGTTVVTLTVTFTDPTTSEQISATDELVVTVSDTTPPVLFASADPSVLWPPNHKLVPVHVDIMAFDACTDDEDVDVQLLWIDSSQDDNGTGDGNTSGDIVDAVPGTYDVDFLLRAERSGQERSGRLYTAMYRATDANGLYTDALVRVLVPHDRGHGDAMNDNGTDKHDVSQARKAAKKAAKLQMKAAKRATKLAKKAYKAALRAAD